MANLYPSPIDMMDHQVFRCFAPYRKTPDDWLGAKFAIYHPEGGPGLDEGLFEWMSILQAALRAPDPDCAAELLLKIEQDGLVEPMICRQLLDALVPSGETYEEYMRRFDDDPESFLIGRRVELTGRR